MPAEVEVTVVDYPDVYNYAARRRQQLAEQCGGTATLVWSNEHIDIFYLTSYDRTGQRLKTERIRLSAGGRTASPLTAN